MENQSVTPTAEKTPEQLEAEMARTRESITEKVAALESQVVGTVQTAANTLSDTVEAVKEFVTNAPEAVSDTMKHAAEAVKETVRSVFDISGHVRNHPWAAVGTSALAGCVAGWLLSGGRGSQRSSDRGVNSAMSHSRFPAAVEAPAPSAYSAPQASGFLGELFATVGRKIREAAENVIDKATTAVTQSVNESVPKLVSSVTERFMPNMGEAPEDRFDESRHHSHG